MENVLSAFKEQKPFKEKRPWDANVIVIDTDAPVPPHYAETIEVLLCCNLSGQLNIGNHSFELSDKQAYFIPPNIIHSMNYKKSNGYVDVLKINLPVINSMLNLDNMLKYYNLEMSNMPIVIKDYSLVEETANTFRYSPFLEEVMQSILGLFHFLIQDSLKNNYSALPTVLNSEFLQRTLSWTEDNFSKNISLDEIAAISNYEKNYFCRKFRSETGVSYFTYLNTLRIQNAVKLLKTGSSIDHACEQSGFDNMEYFVQVFKKNIGITPRKYILSLKEKPNED